jgi:uncharacterized protein with HEPN domain
VRDDNERLLDILDAIDAINRNHPAARERLAADEVLLAATVRWIETIGEAASKLTAGLRATHPDVPWRQAIDTRNRLSHAYFDIDIDQVWFIVERDLPRLEEQVRGILHELERDD